MQFPNNWPENCPPADAVIAEGEVYRIVCNAPPNNSDFQTHFETGKMPKGDLCLRCGLSVFRIAIDAVHMRNKYPKLGNQIAKGTLQKNHGKTKQTGTSSHTTWWIYENVDRASLFTCVTDEA